MPSFSTLKRWLLIFAASGVFFAIAVAAGIYFYVIPNLPATESLQDVRFQVPLRIYSRDMKLMAEFGEKRRLPLDFEAVPELMVKAVLAAEDDRFFEHPGVDYQGLLRAAYYLLRTGEKGQGGSTITMQVARNFFLSFEKTYLRKLNEIMLALKIERELSKEDILTLYLNKIYLGNRAYGVGSAAQVYYGRPITELSLPQLAMIAGLPKAPSKYNPIADPERALIRRDYVLGRMQQLDYIGEMEYQLALATEDDARLHSLAQEVSSPYMAEMVRAEMVERFGERAYTQGFNVIASIDSRLQAAANQAHRQALLAYDQRHGYRGPLARNILGDESDEEQWSELLSLYPETNGLLSALVLDVSEQAAMVYQPQRGLLALDWPGLSWAAPREANGRLGKAPELAAEILGRGDVIYVHQEGRGQWKLAQVPEVEGALVSIDPNDGAIRALVGGFNFASSKFNRVTQAERQPGSNFKPFIYSAGLEQGFTTASLINDAPVVFEDKGLEATWRPENYSGKVFGPTRLREALVKSRNLVSIRLLRAMGINTAIKYVSRFGFNTGRLPKDLSLALGSGAVTPLEIVAGYGVFANGGFRTVPYMIDRIETAEGEVIYRAEPPTVCRRCEHPDPAQVEFQDAFVGPPRQEDVPPAVIAKRVLTPRNVFLIHSMLSDVIRRGTGRKAQVLGRNDLAGKTGTTNDQHDAWFSGFNSTLVTTTWVGYDKPQPLGEHETGGRAALPMWIDYMRVALQGIPQRIPERPPGLVTVRIDPQTGSLAGANHPKAIFETFRVENVPGPRVGKVVSERSVIRPGGEAVSTPAENGVPEELF